MKWSDIEIGSLWMYDNSTAVFQVVCVTDIKTTGVESTDKFGPGVVIRNTDSNLYFHMSCHDFPCGRRKVQPAQATYRKLTAKPIEGIIPKNKPETKFWKLPVHKEMCVDKNVKGDCPICKLIEGGKLK